MSNKTVIKMNCKLEPASKFSEDEKDLFKKLVADKGQVDMKSLNKLIGNSILLFIPDTLNLEAVGALKIPNDNYKKKVFEKAQLKLDKNVKLDPCDFQYEIGWIVSKKKGQGLGKKVVEILLNCQPKKNYATVRKDNGAMIHILEEYGFKKHGNPYDSERGDYKIVLYVKE